MAFKKKKSASKKTHKKTIRQKVRRLNWRPDLPDCRDHLFTEMVVAPVRIPPSVDLRASCPPIVNQGQIGSCSANALAAAFGYLEMQELKKKSNANASDIFNPSGFSPASRLFIYYNERTIEGTVAQDAGARLRDGVKSMSKQGVCQEASWKYQASLLFKKPIVSAYKEAQSHCISSYIKIQTLQEVKQSLAMGFPVVFGFSVYESFESPEVAKSGVMPLPSSDERMLGGHAVMAVGYDEAGEFLWVRNSWGSEWGQQGYFQMPYAYIDKLKQAQDFWTIRK
jgi:C1A family cysteine protease